MSFRNRPVLDRRHRPRWREERRTQQLIVAGFALTMAVALGIFGGTAWNRYYDDHLRPAAVAGGTVFSRDALTTRATILALELAATAERLQAASQPDDPLLEQQLNVLAQQAAQVEAAAADRLVTAAFQRERAEALGIEVREAAIEAEIERRATAPEQVRLSIITLDATPEVASGPQPTEEDFERARLKAEDVLTFLGSGSEFAELASVESSDASATRGGDIGWVSADDPRFAELFEASRGLAAGSLFGPVRSATGYTVARVDEQRPAERDPEWVDRFEAAGVEPGAYRSHIADEVLDEAYRTYFADSIAAPVQEQRRVAQILISEQTGEPVPERRVRHVLIQPLEGEEDQSLATEEQWAEALTRTEEVRELLLAPEADWDEIAAAESADPGSAQRGGDLGWVPVEGSGFVEEFQAALDTLEVGALSEPVRSQFGYHLIQVIDERESAAAQIESIVAELADDPERFAEIAQRSSEDTATAADGGEIGWVARYELDETKEEAIFSLPEQGAISDPIAIPGEGTYLVRLLELAPEREVEEERLEVIRRDGYARWLGELREQAEIWIAPEFLVPAAPAAA